MAITAAMAHGSLLLSVPQDHRNLECRYRGTMVITVTQQRQDEFSSAIVEPIGQPKSGAQQARIVPTNGAIQAPSDNGIPAGEVVLAKRPEPQFFVTFSPVGYVLMWLGIYGLHVVCATYFIAAGYVYEKLPSTSLSGNLALYSLIIPVKYFKTVSVFHYLVATVHCRFLIMPFARYLYKKLTTRGIRRRVRLLRRQVSDEVKVHVTDRLQRSKSSRIVSQKAKSIITYAYALFFARNGFFGVEGNYFEFLFLMRELFETALQSYQAYEMSRLLPQRSLNRFYGVVLIVNCWSTPFFTHYVKHKPLQRLLCMLCDILLDFISSVWVPVFLAMSYIKQYDPVKTDFPTAFWHNDESLVNVMNESPIILFGSAIDAFSRLMFSVSLLSSMEDVKDLVQKEKNDKHKKHKKTTDGPEISRTDKTTIQGQTSAASSLVIKSSVASRTKALIAAGTAQRETIIKWSHRIMIAYGVAILAVQIQAETKSNTHGCVMELRPWLISQRACALVEMNCHIDSTLTGNITNFNEAFCELDANSLEHVVYRHCPEVELGPKLQDFQNLIGIKLYNSTVTTWGADAALTNTHHPRMVFAFFVFTSFPNAAVPDGLLSTDFPQALLDVEFVVTNIDHLPSDLNQRWPVGLNLLLERGPFTAFPSELPTIRPSGLSMAGNQFTDLTQELVNMVGTRVVALSGNPITHISEALNGSACVIKKIYFDATNLSSIPRSRTNADLHRCTPATRSTGNTATTRSATVPEKGLVH